jgi:hypothetical protein
MTVKVIYNFGTGWMTGVSGFDSLRERDFSLCLILTGPQSKSFYFTVGSGALYGH